MSDEPKQGEPGSPSKDLYDDAPTIVKGGALDRTATPLEDEMARVAAQRSHKLPEQIGGYRVRERLGVGGMAEVFLAEQQGPAGFKKRVVVKRILPHYTYDPRFVDLFLREARIAARLSHPNVVQIYELGSADDEYFIVMEYIDGISLYELARIAWAAGQSLPMELVVSSIADAARGLHHAHELVDENGEPVHLVHRDISPDNLMISRDGVTKVLDFGIAKGNEATNLTKTGELKGKVPYMPPEQIQGGEIDRRTDLYALGVSLYWLLTGERPFDGDSDYVILDRVLRSEPPPPRAKNPSIPVQLEAIILQLLKKDREARVPTGAALADQLSNLLPAGSQITVDFVREILELRRQGARAHGSQRSALLASTPISNSLRGPVLSESGAKTPAPYATHVSEVSGVSEFIRQSRRRTFLAAGVGVALALVVGGGISLSLFAGDGSAAPKEAPVALNVDAPPADPDPPVAPPKADKDAQPKADKDAQKVAEPGTDDDAQARDVAAERAADDKPAPERKVRRARAAPRTRSLRVSGPSYVEWRTTSGRLLGKGHATLELPSRTSTIVAIDTRRGGKTRVPVKEQLAYEKLPSGTLDVRVFPFAEVYLGRQKIGPTPVDPIKVVAGHYTLKLKHEGKTRSVDVDVNPGEVKRVKVNLQGG